MSYVANDIQKLFLDGSPEQRKKFLENCPDTMRKSIALMSLVGLGGVYSDVQALQMIAEDLVLKGDVPRGTEMAKAAYKLGQILYDTTNNDEMRLLMRGIVSGSVLSWGDALFKDGYAQQAITAILEGLEWMDELPYLRDFDKQNQEELKLKLASFYVEKGDIDKAKDVLENVIDQSILSDAQKINYQSISVRVGNVVVPVDTKSTALSKKDAEPIIAMLRSIQPMLPMFVQMEWLDAKVIEKVNQVLERVEREEVFDISFSEELSELADQLSELTSKAPSI